MTKLDGVVLKVVRETAADTPGSENACRGESRIARRHRQAAKESCHDLLRKAIALVNLNSLSLLHVFGTGTKDFSPLLKNTGLGKGDEVWLPERTADLKTITELEARGVVVH